MKTRISIKLLAALTTLCLLLALVAVGVSAVVSTDYEDYRNSLNSGLYFKDAEGGGAPEFKILQFSDLNVGLFPYPATLMYIQAAIAATEPDLIVLTGDNTSKISSALGSLNPAVSWICDLFGDIPFTVIFGDEDALLPAGKDVLLRKYMGYSNCLAYDDEPTMAGVANHNLFIFNNEQASRFAIFDQLAFNLWFLDTNTDGLYKDQVNWYRIREDNLISRSTYVDSIPAMAFSHFPFPEINYGNEFFDSIIDRPDGVYDQTNSVNQYDAGVFNAMRDYDAVHTFVSGHYRLSRFERSTRLTFVKGMDAKQFSADFLQTGGSGCKVPDASRGARLITLKLLSAGSSGVTSTVDYTTEIISYDAALYSEDEDAAAANALTAAAYRAGANTFFGPFASLLASVIPFGKARAATAIAISRWFGSTFSFIS